MPAGSINEQLPDDQLQAETPVELLLPPYAHESGGAVLPDWASGRDWS